MPRSLSLLLLIACLTGAFYLVYRITTGPSAAHAPQALRPLMAANDKLSRGLVAPTHLARSYPDKDIAKRPRTNAKVGMGGPTDTAGYAFYLADTTGDTAGRPRYTLAGLGRLPPQKLTYNFKCVEGWSQVMGWQGYRLADLLMATGLASKTGQPVRTGREPHAYRYVGLASMDGGYYVGLDMARALHPQTLLATRLNGALLPPLQGAPLRLVVPTAYGVKSIMKIGKIYCRDTPPPDYWYERGYGYDLAL